MFFRCDSISTNTLYTGYLLTHIVTDLKLSSIRIALPFREDQIVKKDITTIQDTTANASITTITAATAIKTFSVVTVKRSTTAKIGCRDIMAITDFTTITATAANEAARHTILTTVLNPF